MSTPHDPRQAPADSPVQHATGTSGQSPDAGLARQLSELARELRATHDTDALLHRITAAAVDEITGADYAGISLVDNKVVRSVAATHQIVIDIDRMQYDLQEGPCLQALREHQTVRTDDLADEPRWPAFARAVRDLGCQSMLAVQLFVEDDNLGSLNLYADKPHAFTDDESTAMLLASHAAIAMKGDTVERNLRTALGRRDVIGQAKGILMERYKINAGEAFDLLVLASQRTHTKLHTLAGQLTETGELRTE